MQGATFDCAELSANDSSLRLFASFPRIQRGFDQSLLLARGEMVLSCLSRAAGDEVRGISTTELSVDSAVILIDRE
ncbi:hypothetical protein EAH85_14180 [Curtobacterium flaccumfaciens]|nr:hypothetical protein EAH85_14180 [Curtobacterium flaccumfaciens]